MAVTPVMKKKPPQISWNQQGGHCANLPGANALWHFAISVEESQPQLDDLQEVHVAPQELQKDKVIIIKTL